MRGKEMQGRGRRMAGRTRELPNLAYTHGKKLHLKQDERQIPTLMAVLRHHVKAMTCMPTCILCVWGGWGCVERERQTYTINRLIN